MTKEEIEKEAEENSFRYTLDKPWICEVERKQIMTNFKKGYLAGSEPRENRITELEKENGLLKQKFDVLDEQIPWKDIKDKSELIKENEELKEMLSRLKFDFKNFAFEVGVEPISETYFEVEKFLQEINK